MEIAQEKSTNALISVAAVVVIVFGMQAATRANVRTFLSNS